MQADQVTKRVFLSMLAETACALVVLHVLSRFDTAIATYTRTHLHTHKHTMPLALFTVGLPPLPPLVPLPLSLRYPLTLNLFVPLACPLGVHQRAAGGILCTLRRGGISRSQHGYGHPPAPPHPLSLPWSPLSTLNIPGSPYPILSW